MDTKTKGRVILVSTMCLIVGVAMCTLGSVGWVLQNNDGMQTGITGTIIKTHGFNLFIGFMGIIFGGAGVGTMKALSYLKV